MKSFDETIFLLGYKSKIIIFFLNPGYGKLKIAQLLIELDLKCRRLSKFHIVNERI